MPDPPDLMRQALRQRDNGDVLHPSMHDYDGAMQRTWGGPAQKWFPMAMAKYPKQFAAAAGRTALVTGGTGGIGFYVAKLLAAANMTVIIPARPNLMHEAKSAQQAITAAIPTASVFRKLTVPGLYMGSIICKLCESEANQPNVQASR